MPGQKRVLKDIGTIGARVHPDDSALLTYIDLPFPDKARSNVHQHVAQCEPCQIRHGELKRTADLLAETLTHFDEVQYYPTLTEKVLKSIDNPTAVRLKRRKERLRKNPALGPALGVVKAVVLNPLLPVLPLLSTRQRKPRNLAMASIPVLAIPVVLFLVLLAVFVVLASNTENFKYFRPYSVTNTSQAQYVQTIESHPSVMPTAKLFKELPGSPVPTVTASSSGPTISPCSIQNVDAQTHLSFCGANFTPGDQVQLLEYFVDGHSRLRRPVIVSAQGTFQDWWIVYNCRMVPFSVMAEDVTPGHMYEVSQVYNIQFLNCVNPTPTPTAEGVQAQH